MLEDELNRLIVQILRGDGRTAFSDIAQRLGVSEGTVRNRVSAMKRSGVLQIVAVTDAAAKEYHTEALLGIRVRAGIDPDHVARRLSGLDDVVYVAWVSGRYDLMVEVISGSEVSLVKLLSQHVHGSDDIASAEVMTGLKNYKNQFLLKRNWS
ncbi:MAG: AsnC family transcriptional regulator [Pseudomonadota bacterium]